MLFIGYLRKTKSNLGKNFLHPQKYSLPCTMHITHKLGQYNNIWCTYSSNPHPALLPINTWNTLKFHMFM